jgi:PPOX class probable FMN-dependent enzyme
MKQVATWQQEIERALQANNGHPEANFVQVATIAADGAPANRTMVFRGFRPGGSMLLASDARTPAVAELAVDPRVAICWFMPAEWEQFRIRGRAEIIDASATGEDAALRDATWARLSPPMRRRYAGPAPGAPRADVAAFEAPAAPIPAAPPLEQFVLVRVAPETIDHLDMRTEPYPRHRYALGVEDWEQAPLNP